MTRRRKKTPGPGELVRWINSERRRSGLSPSSDDATGRWTVTANDYLAALRGARNAGLLVERDWKEACPVCGRGSRS